MGIAGPHPGGAPARRRKRCPTGAGAPTPRGGGGGGAQSDSAYRLGKVLGAILHSVVECFITSKAYLLSAGQKIRPGIFGAGRRHRPHEPPARPFSAHVARPEQA